MVAAMTWLALLASALWFLLSAKLHGRQIRLERELRGYNEVSFGPGVQNPGWVEGLWHRDRVQYWTTAAFAAMVYAAWAVLAPRAPFADLAPAIAALVAGVVWGMATAFLLNGASSFWRFEQDRMKEPFPGPGGSKAIWLRRVRLASVVYWATAAVMGALAIGLALV